MLQIFFDFFHANFPRYAPNSQRAPARKVPHQAVSLYMSDPEDPVADAAWQTLFLSAWAEAPLPGFAEGGAPAPSPVVATESPDRAGVQDALLVLIFCYLRLEPQCRLTLCRRNARPILHVVAMVHPRVGDWTAVVACHCHARTTKNRPPKDRPNNCAA